MTVENLKTISSLEVFLQGSQPVACCVLGDKTKRYWFIRKTLVKFSYRGNCKALETSEFIG